MAAKGRIRLVHWNAAEAKERANRLRSAGYAVAAEPWSQHVMRSVRRRPPEAVVIDLDRSPSQGRDVGLWLRTAKATREVPIVFAGGDSAKVRGVKRLLPDAEYTAWARVRSALRRALARPPADPVVPASVLAGYSGTPLVKKLGIKPGARVVLVGASADFDRTLGALPEDVVVRRQNRGARDLTIWFTKRRRELERDIAKMAGLVGSGGLWICWPKKASGVAGDVSEPDVRRTGLAAGLVDYKVCAVDQTWSGLKFATRK